MPIALLKFPNDLLREVFRLCYPFELYNLSKCSKKCSQKSITLGGAKNWKISYWGGREIVVLVDDSDYYFIKTDNPEDYFKINFGRFGNYMFIEFPNGESVDVFIYLIKILGIRIVKSLKTTFGSIAIVSKLAKVLVDRYMEIEHFEIGHVAEVQDVVNFAPMLSQMSITQDIRCFLKFPPGFHFELVKYARKIDIDNASWFTIDQLLNCTSVRIELRDSILSNHDLDLFLRKWKKAGEFPNLRWLTIGSENIDNKFPILEMNLPIENVGNPNLEVLINGHGDGVRVIKDDGTVGWLKVNAGFCGNLNAGFCGKNCGNLKFVIADPADTLVEEVQDNEEEEW
ncbi:unnamed protein product [Caenorhabditis nigoni]